MAGIAALKEEQYEKIITSRMVFGQTVRQTAETLNVGGASVQRVEAAFKAVQAGDWEKCAGMVESRACPYNMIEWSAKRLGLELPPIVTEARERMYEPKEAKPAPPPPAPAAPDHWEEEKLLLQTLIGTVKQQNELLEQLYDVVLPKWVGDIKDNVNINSDQQTQALKRIEGLVEAVKINTRRRGT